MEYQKMEKLSFADQTISEMVEKTHKQIHTLKGENDEKY